MTYSTYNINTPSPYLVLHKNDKIPQILLVSQSNSDSKNSVETDLKILTAHRSNGETLITKIASKDGLNDFIIPGKFLTNKLNNLLQFDCIKLGTLTEDSITVLNENIKNIVAPIIISGDDLNTVSYNNLKETIFPQSELIVCNAIKVQELLSLSKKVSILEDVFEIANQLSTDTSSLNVLITNCILGDSSVVDVFYSDKDQQFIVFRNVTYETTCDSMITTAIASNLGHGFTTKEAVYGALEYVQSTLSVMNGHDELPNCMYAIETPLKRMIKDECFTAHDLIPITKPLKNTSIVDNFYEYIIQHPLVEPYWKTYINHDFVRQIADGTLPLKKFQFFVEQDYSYLVDYGRVHCIAGSKAPELKDMEEELIIVGRIREEMSQHEKRLKEEFGVKDDGYFQSIKRGPALNNYSRYFNDVAKRGNWQELVAALTPCMMGYGAAAMQYKGKVTAAKGGMYDEWINIYSCENYENGMEIGASLLNHIARTYPAEELETLIRIYGEVCDLETKFWDAALEYE